MKLNEFLSIISEKELIDRLLFIDNFLKYLHLNNYYVCSDFRNIKVIVDNGDFKIDSESVQIVNFNEERDSNAQRYDLLELIAVEICAFNHFVDENKTLKLITESGFINSLFVKENLDVFLDNVPDVLHQYYQRVFLDGEIESYLNDYIDKCDKYVLDRREYNPNISPFYRIHNNAAYANYFSLIVIIVSLILFVTIFIVILVA